jgi:hypothetical protein
MTASVLWRRLDTPGHDACRLRPAADGRELEGTAVFLSDGAVACVDYQVFCDASWQSRHGRVRGWIGDTPLDLGVAGIIKTGAIVQISNQSSVIRCDRDPNPI